jgi:hypothetical protein
MDRHGVVVEGGLSESGRGLRWMGAWSLSVRRGCGGEVCEIGLVVRFAERGRVVCDLGCGVWGVE